MHLPSSWQARRRQYERTRLPTRIALIGIGLIGASIALRRTKRGGVVGHIAITNARSAGDARQGARARHS